MKFITNTLLLIVMTLTMPLSALPVHHSENLRPDACSGCGGGESIDLSNGIFSKTLE
jgi:hypothetical protein